MTTITTRNLEAILEDSMQLIAGHGSWFHAYMLDGPPDEFGGLAMLETPEMALVHQGWAAGTEELVERLTSKPRVLVATKASRDFKDDDSYLPSWGSALNLETGEEVHFHWVDPEEEPQDATESTTESAELHQVLADAAERINARFPQASTYTSPDGAEVVTAISSEGFVFIEAAIEDRAEPNRMRLAPERALLALRGSFAGYTCEADHLGITTDGVVRPLSTTEQEQLATS